MDKDKISKHEENPMSMPKGQFYYWSIDGTGANAWIQMLKKHYSNLAATYLQKDMKREAELFSKIVEEFVSLERDVLESRSEKPSTE